MTAAGNRPAGFDYMRISLAVAIILFHSFYTSYGNSHDTMVFYGIVGPVSKLLVPMFFALSGFLVAGSLERSRTLVSFLGLRVIRIVPALFVETVLSAVVLGALFTTLPRAQYFMSEGFRVYFTNIIGIIHYSLPGVFTHNPAPEVNLQLWTIPAELKCYIALAVAFVLAPSKFRPWVVALMAIGIWTWDISRPPHTVNEGLGFPSHLFIVCFLLGVLGFTFRSRIPWNGWVAAVGALIAMVSVCFPRGAFVACAPVVYLTLYLGLMNPGRAWLIRSGDYSYGLYLYGFPVQQALMTDPALRHWYLNIPLGVVSTGLFAALSWHLVEKRVLDGRSILYAAENRLLAVVGPLGDRLLAWTPLRKRTVQTAPAQTARNRASGRG